MTEPLSRLRRVEPSAKLDARVRRRMRAALEHDESDALVPFEGIAYAIVLALYLVHATVDAVRLFQEARTARALLRQADASLVSPRERLRPLCETASCLSPVGDFPGSSSRCRSST
jgi:hypothetical protein